jgi:hypothetical protein
VQNQKTGESLGLSCQILRVSLVNILVFYCIFSTIGGVGEGRLLYNKIFPNTLILPVFFKSISK